MNTPTDLLGLANQASVVWIFLVFALNHKAKLARVPTDVWQLKEPTCLMTGSF